MNQMNQIREKQRYVAWLAVSALVCAAVATAIGLLRLIDLPSALAMAFSPLQTILAIVAILMGFWALRPAISSSAKFANWILPSAALVLAGVNIALSLWAHVAPVRITWQPFEIAGIELQVPNWTIQSADDDISEGELVLRDPRTDARFALLWWPIGPTKDIPFGEQAALFLPRGLATMKVIAESQVDRVASLLKPSTIAGHDARKIFLDKKLARKPACGAIWICPQSNRMFVFVLASPYASVARDASEFALQHINCHASPVAPTSTHVVTCEIPSNWAVVRDSQQVFFCQSPEGERKVLIMGVADTQTQQKDALRFPPALTALQEKILPELANAEPNKPVVDRVDGHPAVGYVCDLPGAEQKKPRQAKIVCWHCNQSKRDLVAVFLDDTGSATDWIVKLAKTIRCHEVN